MTAVFALDGLGWLLVGLAATPVALTVLALVAVLGAGLNHASAGASYPRQPCQPARHPRQGAVPVTSTPLSRRARALDVLALAPQPVRGRAAEAFGSGVPGRWLVVDAMGATFHSTAEDAARAWLGLHDTATPDTSMAWLVDLDAQGAAGVSGAIRHWLDDAAAQADLAVHEVTG